MSESLSERLLANVTLDQVNILVLIDELKVSKLLIPFSLSKARCFTKSVDGLLDMPDCLGLHNVHFHQNWWRGNQNRVIFEDISIEECACDVNT